MVFYSRYYIHEMLLVFFAGLAGGAGWRYWRTRRLGWLLLAGAGAGLMHATKETFVISVVAALLALGANWMWNRWLDASPAPVKPPRLTPWHFLAGALIWGGVWLLLFSSFFSNAAGPLDSFRTYQAWLSRAGGASPHVHPWSFYFHRLLWFHAAKGPVWSEALIAGLALVGAAAGFARKRLGDSHAGFVRFLACYTGALTVAYCLISYKTPWCLLGFWHGAILLAGVGTAVILRSVAARAARVAVSVLVLAGACHLAFQARRATGAFASDPANPYVYAQTLPGALELVDQVKALADAQPDHRAMLLKVIAPEDDYWPLPWYLHDFSRVGWFDALPADPFAPVMIVSASLHANLDEKKTHQMPSYYEFRPGIFFELYVETNLWRTYVEKRPRPKE